MLAFWLGIKNVLNSIWKITYP